MELFARFLRLTAFLLFVPNTPALTINMTAVNSSLNTGVRQNSQWLSPIQKSINNLGSHPHPGSKDKPRIQEDVMPKNPIFSPQNLIVPVLKTRRWTATLPPQAQALTHRSGSAGSLEIVSQPEAGTNHVLD